MKLSQLFIEHLDRETANTRRALERVPEGKADWKPHAKSMPLGYLATLVATMPSWLTMMVERENLDIGKGEQPSAPRTNRDLIALFDQSVAGARKALAGATDEHLAKNWQLLVNGNVVDEKPRYAQISETFTHLAHHRGQLTVYLRLNEQPVPSIYGPTADENWSA